MMVTKISAFVLALSILNIFCDFGSIHRVGKEYETKLANDFYNFVVEIQTNSSDTYDYVSKVQAIFCPQQPICDMTGEYNSSAVLATLPASFTIGNATIQTGHIPEVFRICCYPCACTCEVDGNCCLTKRVITNATYHANSTRNGMTSKCIESSLSDQGMISLKYYMIQKCFGETSNATLISDCENSEPRTIENTLPVTSVRTGHIYKNKACALCNNADETLIRWNVTVRFKHPSISAHSIRVSHDRPNTTEQLLIKILTHYGHVIYAPPIPVDNKRCTEKKHITHCKGEFEHNLNESTDKLKLKEMCKSFYNPIEVQEIVERPTIYSNIFCYLFCLNRIRRGLSVGCMLTGDPWRFYPNQITGLVDYSGKINTRQNTGIRKDHRRSGNCPCNQIYDKYKNECRSIFCPIGELPVDCDCIWPFKIMSGLPIIVKLIVEPDRCNDIPDDVANSSNPNKLIPNSGSDAKKTPIDTDIEATTKTTRLNKRLEIKLHDIFYKVKAETVLVHRQVKKGKTSCRYLYFMIVRATQGHGTKDAVFPMIRFLDSATKIYFTVGKTKYFAQFTNRVKLSYEISKTIATENIIVKYIVSEENDFVLQYWNNDLLDVTFVNLEALAILSPLLFCKQVELGPSEFTVIGDVIYINYTKQTVTPDCYKKISLERVRVCIEQYIQYSNRVMAGHRAVWHVICIQLLCIIFRLL